MIAARERERLAKSNQEQAVASWINYLNQLRLDALSKALNEQDANLSQAIKTIDATFKVIRDDIVIRNRGGIKGMHGFIAEVAECGIGNARQAIQGKAPNYIWINDNGPADLVRDGIPIQQKFVNAGNHLSLQAIKQHLESYPWFLGQGGKYQIPEDHYKKICYLLSIPKEQAYKMATSTGEFSLKQWQEVQDFFNNGDVKLSDIEPSKLSYKDVLPGKIEDTLKNEKSSLRETDKEIRQQAYEDSKPTLNEGMKAAAAAAVIEGGFTFITAIIRKIKTGKSIKDFNEDDWTEILKESGVSFAKGGIRGASIYALTNFTATPAAVANSLVTASFGVAQQTYLLKTGAISTEDFILNSEVLCLDVSVSALSSFVGQAIIPVPVLGAVIGNTVGMFIYSVAKDNLKKKERMILEGYLRELEELEKSLDREYRIYVRKLNEELRKFYALLEDAFAVNCSAALEGSVELATYLGVPAEELLKNSAEVDDYFLN